MSARSRIDYFSITGELDGARLILQVAAADPSAVADGPSLLSISMRRPEAATNHCHASGAVAKVEIPVPALSQMVDSKLGPRLCSPTSVSMVLGHYGIPVQLLEVARQAYHAGHDLYGVWPAALYAASRHHLLGYLLWFSDWDEARWLLDRGVPIVASIRYEEGELDGAPVASTAGHLVVVRGYDADSVLVNDPAAPLTDNVPRDYSIEQFLGAWLQGSGVGYVLFPSTD